MLVHGDLADADDRDFLACHGLISSRNFARRELASLAEQLQAESGSQMNRADISDRPPPPEGGRPSEPEAG
jgi:hypothetical protein